MFPCIGNILTLGLKAVAVWAATCLNARDINDNRRMWLTGNRPHHSFTLFHVLFLEQELTIEIGNVNGVQIKQCNLAETRKNDVFHYRRNIILEKVHEIRVKNQNARSSHPIPPAPTRSTLVFASRECNSEPRIALA
jgi:hypothetical protein